MIYYSAHPGCTNPNHEKLVFFKDNDIRIMLSAAYYRNPVLSYACDNGAWTDFCRGLPFNSKRFLDTLKRIDKLDKLPDFVVMPDIVTGGKSSLSLSKQYLYLTEDYPCYLPVQDGMVPEDLDGFGDIAGLFVGGSTDWKWNTVGIWSDYAHDNGMFCHVGRVGTLENFIRCGVAGVDSADGSGLIRNGKYHNIPYYLKCAREQISL